MIHIALFAIALAQTPAAPPAQTPQTPAGQAAPDNQTPHTVVSPAMAESPSMPNLPAMFIKPVVVNEPIRIAMTPRIDGKIETEEWDPFTTSEGGADTFFQWEPGKMHLAAQHVPMGQDLLISVDGHGDGWLAGRDNVEIRVHWNGAAPEITERVLDNTPMTGPVWIDVSSVKEATMIASTQDDKGRNVELTVMDPAAGILPVRAEQTIGLRMDMIPETTPPSEPLMPRVVAPIHLLFARGAGLPAGLSWRPEIISRSVVPGERSKIRLTFKGNNELGMRRIEMRTAGLAQNETESIGIPFPGFDKKGRAFVDYRTQVTREAAEGYRVMRAVMVDSQGRQSILETSYEIAPVVTLSLNNKMLATSSEPQNVKFSAQIHSNSTRRLDGLFRVEVPDGWKIMSGGDTQFLIYDSRGMQRKVFEIQIPASFKGTAPIKLVADIARHHVEQVE